MKKACNFKVNSSVIRKLGIFTKISPSPFINDTEKIKYCYIIFLQIIRMTAEICFF